ncbi:MAG TPA: 50S ribosomal protein L34 [Thermomicrobiales bacterium]|nr:50S ribosomal protein L34 [Thermomicrobiales bacterium]
MRREAIVRRIYQPHGISRKREHRFMARMATNNGRLSPPDQARDEEIIGKT